MGYCTARSLSIKKLTCTIFLFLFSFCFIVYGKQDWQNELKLAHEAITNGNKSLAFEQYQHYAEKENGLAQFTLAWYIKTGWLNGQADIKSACHWFKRSAKHKIPVGLQETGHCIRDKIIPVKDPEKIAIAYYDEAQQHGIFTAACDALRVEVNTLNINPPPHLLSCEQAAARNAIYAQEILIELYADVDGLNDNARALYWLELAAPKSSKSAYRYALTLNSADKIPKKDVIYWFESAANLGYLPAYLHTAANYYKQITPETKPKQASMYLAKSYMWIQAWLKRNKEIKEVPHWITQVLTETPKSWHKALDKKVTEHVDKFALLEN